MMNTKYTPVVLVHLGQYIPSYLSDCVQQIKLWMPENPIYLLLDPRGFSQLDSTTRSLVELISTDQIPLTPEHIMFHEKCTLDKHFRSGFWWYALERFMTLSDLCTWKPSIAPFFHLENDNLIYQHLQNLVPLLQELGYRMGATFDSPQRCIPGIVYFGDPTAAIDLGRWIAVQCGDKNDMEMLCMFYLQHADWFQSLPTTPPDYPDKLLNFFTHNIERFQCIFDAAALGQYIGGVDPRNSGGRSTLGFINETSHLKPNRVRILWKQNSEGLWYSTVNDLPVVNLHIHSKDLRRWRSARTQP